MRYIELVRAGTQLGKIRAGRFVLGILLCALLALFGVERRVAAYPSHNVAASAVAATGIQKPEQIVFSAPQTVSAPELFVAVAAVFALAPEQRNWNRTEPRTPRAPGLWFATPLAVRPPPTV